MVRVPLAENQVQQQGPSRARLQAFDTGAAEAVAGAARSIAAGISDVAEAKARIEWEVEAAGAKQLDVEFDSAAREALYNPETGFANSQGINALNARAGVEEALTKKRAEILAKATSPRQRDMLAPILDDRMASYMSTVGRHAATEGRRYADDASNARIVNATQSAIAKYQDPEALKRELGTVAVEVELLAQRNGWAPEQKAMEMQRRLGQAHAGIIDTLANTDPEAAVAWLDKHRPEIPATDAERLADMLQPAVEARRAERTAMGIIGIAEGAPMNAPRDHDLGKYLAAVDARDDLTPEAKKRTKAAIEGIVRTDRALLSDAQEKAAERAWEMVDAGRAPPPSLMGQLRPSARRSIRNALESGEGMAGGFARQSSVDQLVAAENMAAMDPDAFAKVDLNQVRGQFSRGDWLRLVKEQRDIRQGGGGKPTAERAIVTATAETMRAAGLDLVGLKGEKRQVMAGRIVAAREAIRADVRAFEARHKRQPDPDEIQEMADRQLLKVQVWKDGMFGGSGEDALLFEARGKAKAAGGTVRYDTADVVVPEAFRQQFQQKWRRANNGRTPTERDIARAYLQLGL